MEFKTAKLDTQATIISILTTTFLVGLSFFFIIKVPFGWIFAILMMSIVVCSYLLSPQKYYLAGGNFIIEKVIGSKIAIPLNEIDGFRRISDFCKLKPMRALGNGGLFGYYGIFTTRDYGNINCQLTSLKNVCIIKTKKGNYAISPLELGRFEEYLKSLTGITEATETVKSVAPEKIKYASPFILIIPDTIFTLTIIMVILLYPHLPERIATHFDFHGNPDGWGHKTSFIIGGLVPSFVLFALNIVIFFITRTRTTEPRIANFMVILISLVQIFIAYTSFDIYWFNMHNHHLIPIPYALIVFLLLFIFFLSIYYKKIKKT